MRQLNFAMIGHGFMGKAHSYALLATPFFFKTGIEPVRKLIVGRNAETVKRAAESFGWEEFSTDWREAVRRPDIDAVAIVTPPNTHSDIAIAAAEAGKHIFCEKPFTVTTQEAEAALAARVRFPEAAFPAFASALPWVPVPAFLRPFVDREVGSLGKP